MSSTADFDILIVGSGPSGCHAAMEAVASGRKVAVLDIGYVDERFQQLIPTKPFSEIRRTDPNQHLYFLGEDVEATLRDQGRAGPHLTPARLHMIRDASAIFPLESDTFLPLQSTGLGGLGISWGANCFALEDFELERIGISPAEIRRHYAGAAEEVGLSGRTDDALAPLIANLDHRLIQPPLPLDSNAESISKRYEAKQTSYKERGFYLGQSLLAMLSEPVGERQANPGNDMDFWADTGKSVYRPRFTMEKLRKYSNLTYVPKHVASRFQEGEGAVTVECRNVVTGTPARFTARKLLLAAGAINSGRMALASFQDYETRLPILCNPNHWVAAINLSMLGKPARDKRHSLSQLTILMRTEAQGADYVLAQVYSYRSLLQFRLLKDVPLPTTQALLFLRLIATAFTCVNIQFSDHPSPDRWIKLEANSSGDTLKASCSFSGAEQTRLKRYEARMLRFLAGLRCIPMGIKKPKHGASIHYVGTLPYSSEDRPFTTESGGRLRGTSNVYIADGSSWRFMPAKGLTFTLMANARRVAARAVADLDGRGSGQS